MALFSDFKTSFIRLFVYVANVEIGILASRKLFVTKYFETDERYNFWENFERCFPLFDFRKDSCRIFFSKNTHSFCHRSSGKKVVHSFFPRKPPPNPRHPHSDFALFFSARPSGFKFREEKIPPGSFHSKNRRNFGAVYGVFEIRRATRHRSRMASLACIFLLAGTSVQYTLRYIRL